MSFTGDLMRVNSGINTTLHGVRTAKMAEDHTNLILLGIGVFIGLLLLSSRGKNG